MALIHAAPPLRARRHTLPYIPSNWDDELDTLEHQQFLQSPGAELMNGNMPIAPLAGQQYLVYQR